MKIFLTIFGMLGLITNAYASSSQNRFTSMLPMVLALAGIIYFILIRPDHKQQNKLSKLISELKVSDRIKLSSGIIGTIKTVEKQYLTLEIAKEVIITVDKLSVLERMPENT